MNSVVSDSSGSGLASSAFQFSVPVSHRAANTFIPRHVSLLPAAATPRGNRGVRFRSCAAAVWFRLHSCTLSVLNVSVNSFLLWRRETDPV